MLTGSYPFQINNFLEYSRNIDKLKFEFPEQFPSEAKRFISMLCHRNPNKRPSFSQIKCSRLFNGFDWLNFYL